MNTFLKFFFAFALFFTSVTMEKQLRLSEEGKLVNSWSVSIEWGVDAKAEMAAM